jgi:hypothetical protein
VARTVWLAAFCLLGVGPFALIKVITATSAPPIATDIVSAGKTSEAAGTPEETLAKSDRLPILHPIEAKREQVTLTAAAAPPQTAQLPKQDDTPKIVPRHWHEGETIPGAKHKLTRRLSGKGSNTTVASNRRANEH